MIRALLPSLNFDLDLIQVLISERISSITMFPSIVLPRRRKRIYFN